MGVQARTGLLVELGGDGPAVYQLEQAVLEPLQVHSLLTWAARRTCRPAHAQQTCAQLHLPLYPCMPMPPTTHEHTHPRNQLPSQPMHGCEPPPARRHPIQQRAIHAATKVHETTAAEGKLGGQRGRLEGQEPKAHAAARSNESIAACGCIAPGKKS